MSVIIVINLDFSTLISVFCKQNVLIFFSADLCHFQARKVRKIFYFLFALGLEYLIEIQHNTLKKMPNNYYCLLCDVDIKVKKDPVDTVDLAKNHLKSTGHKLKYLVRQNLKELQSISALVRLLSIMSILSITVNINQFSCYAY